MLCQVHSLIFYFTYFYTSNFTHAFLRLYVSHKRIKIRYCHIQNVTRLSLYQEIPRSTRETERSKWRYNYFPVNRVSYTFRRSFLRKSMQQGLELKKANERISLDRCKIPCALTFSPGPLTWRILTVYKAYVLGRVNFSYGLLMNRRTVSWRNVVVPDSITISFANHEIHVNLRFSCKCILDRHSDSYFFQQLIWRDNKQTFLGNLSKLTKKKLKIRYCFKHAINLMNIRVNKLLIRGYF